MNGRRAAWRRVAETVGGAGLCALAATASALSVSGMVGASGGRAGTVTVEAAAQVEVPAGDPEPPIAPLGSMFDSDASLPAHAESVHTTTLRATLDPDAHTLAAEGTILWRNLSSKPATEIYFHLYLNAFKNERSVFLRSRLGDGRGSHLPSDWGFIDVKRLGVRGSGVDLWAAASKFTPDDPEDETDIRVPLTTPIPPGGEILLEIAFDVKLPTITERTGYQKSFHMVAQWFPKPARHTRDGAWVHFPFHRLSEFYADYGTYDVTLDVPTGFSVGATGRRISEEKRGNRTIVRHVQSDVHDFAWAAWDAFVERRERIEGVDVVVLSPPGHEPTASRELEALRVAIPCYGKRFGRYPYPTLTVIHPPRGAEEAGGMEYPTLITTAGPWFGPPLVHLSAALTVHEFGHQHFYGLLATNEHASPFLDEGLNSYAENRCLAEIHPGGSLVLGLGASVANEAAHREGAMAVGHDDVVARSSASFPTALHFGRLVYSRTATLLSTLEGAYGRDMIDRALGRYARAYRFQHPDPRHLVAAFSDAGGPGVAENLRVGLFERGWVDFAVVDLHSTTHATAMGVFDRQKGRETVTAAQPSGTWDGWALVVRRGTLKLPVEIDLLLEDGSTRRTSWDGQGDWARIAYSGPSRLVGAVVDPERRILIDERFSNNAFSQRPGRFGWRTFERAGYVLSLLGLAVAP